MPHAKFVMFSNFIPYLYIYHPNSTSKSLVPEKKIKYIKDDIYIIKSFQKLALSYKQDNLLLYKVIYNQSQNVLFSLVYSLYKNKKTWCNMGINTAVVAELKKEKLYPIRGKFDSIKKTICARLFLNIPCVLE